MSQPKKYGLSEGPGPVSPVRYSQIGNETLDALLSSHFGTTRPTYAKAGTVWIKDTEKDPKVWEQYIFNGREDILIGTYSEKDKTFKTGASIPLTTTGDILSYFKNDVVRVPAGKPGQVLMTMGDDYPPTWSSSVASEGLLSGIVNPYEAREKLEVYDKHLINNIALLHFAIMRGIQESGQHDSVYDPFTSSTLTRTTGVVWEDGVYKTNKSNIGADLVNANTVINSPYYGAYAISNVYDDTLKTYYQSYTPDNAYVGISLSTPKKIKRLGLRQGFETVLGSGSETWIIGWARTFGLDYSNNGTNWTRLDVLDSGFTKAQRFTTTAIMNYFHYDFENVPSAKYWRIQLVDQGAAALDGRRFVGWFIDTFEMFPEGNPEQWNIKSQNYVLQNGGVKELRLFLLFRCHDTINFQNDCTFQISLNNGTSFTNFNSIQVPHQGGNGWALVQVNFNTNGQSGNNVVWQMTTKSLKDIELHQSAIIPFY